MLNSLTNQANALTERTFLVHLSKWGLFFCVIRYMTYWIILGFSTTLNAALGYWIYKLKKTAFIKAAEEIKEAAKAVRDIGDKDVDGNPL